MKIGLILPAKSKKQPGNFIKRLAYAIGSLVFTALPVENTTMEIQDGLSFFICTIPFENEDITMHEGLRKKIRMKLDKAFEENRVWPVLEHPKAKGCYLSQELQYEEAVAEVAANRFEEIMRLLQGVGDLSTKEILVTGSSFHLEQAISRLITSVRSMNILLPEGGREPDEAESAFEETGIPVHITTDTDVIKRTSVWLRFPKDDESFDVLPERFKGIIVDFGALKIIDTKNKKIFGIVLEFSDKIKRKIGHSILDAFGRGVLEGVVTMACANAWDMNVTETSYRLGMRLSFKS